MLYIVLDDVGYSAMQRSGLLATVGADHVFPTTPAAVAWAQSVADAPTPG